MIEFLLRRLMHAAGLLFAASIVVFLILHLIPGDPAAVLAGPTATAEQIESIRQNLGLDDPLPAQYGRWAVGVLTGDLGVSVLNGLPVAELISQRWLPTVTLAVGASVLSVFIAIPTGVIAARREGRPIDWIISTSNAVIISIPAFWMGILAILVFGLYLQIFPTGGYVSLTEDPPAALRHLLLPVVILAINQAAILSRFVKSAVAETLSSDHVRTARAKGLQEIVIVRDHALRNALVPILTIFGLQFGGMLTGTVVIEAVFSWPGLGRLVVDAIKVRDYPVVQGCLLVLVLIFVLVNLFTDILYGIVDPRISIAGKAS